MSETVPVVRGDREAAETLWNALPEDPSESALEQLARAFARHRLEAIEEAARVAGEFRLPGGRLSDWLRTNESPAEAQRRMIASAIRALGRGEG